MYVIPLPLFTYLFTYFMGRFLRGLKTTRDDEHEPFCRKAASSLKLLEKQKKEPRKTIEKCSSNPVF